MKLYRCKTPTNHLCPCGKVARELDAAGIEYETVRVPISHKPEKRPKVVELTGQARVPVVEDDEGKGMHDSKRLVEAIKAGEIRTGAGTAPTTG